MTERRFLGDMLAALFERRRAGPVLGDDRSLEEMCLALLDIEGEVSGIALAKAILDRYATLTEDEKHAFFAFLTTHLDVDLDALQGAIDAYRSTQAPSDYKAITREAEPKRQELLRRLNQPPRATQALVQMRADLLKAIPSAPDLARTDLDFQHLLRSWFNRGFLDLRQICWDTPASILEKIVAYEAVHAIQDWDELRRRLYPQDRRCFAFFHPAMPDEPLIFVEVALTQRIPSAIQHLLADDREPRRAEETKVAVFYSISNCQAGLSGISFGNLLIKQVVAELRQELPGLDTFVTLSPIPKLTKWLESYAEAPGAAQILDGTATPAEIQAAATHYLLTAKTKNGAPFDPVARFHLGNGAQIHAVHGAADLSEKGLKGSAGAMVNYEYDLSQIEKNHERFVHYGEIARAPGLESKPALVRLGKRAEPHQP